MTKPMTILAALRSAATVPCEADQPWPYLVGDGAAARRAIEFVR